jgi:hypothetical protein
MHQVELGFFLLGKESALILKAVKRGCFSVLIANGLPLYWKNVFLGT